MLNDIKENKPWKLNQIKNDKPNVPTSDSILTGYIANSMNGGHNKTIFFKQIMAGERHKEMRIQLNVKLLTPKTPSYQNVTCTVRTYFVPNIRVWRNAEKFTAQKGGASEYKIQEVPNLASLGIPLIYNEGLTGTTPLQHTTAWRDTFISSYLPRMGIFGKNGPGSDEIWRILPAVSALPLRGRIAIYNDFERNKEYEEEREEFDGNLVTDQEWASYLPTTDYSYFANSMRAKRGNSYYSDYRTELQGFEESYPPSDMSADTALMNWAQWEMKIAEARSQAENAQLNDWDVIAKIRGSKKLTEGKVQLLSEKTFNLNYSTVTQSTYNTNPDIDETYQAMGTQGAYSYTNVDLPLYAGMEFVEEGYIHVIATVSADTVFETGFDRLELNVKALDQYRPDMLDDKKDVLYEIEYGTENVDGMTHLTQVRGFKRKYNEYYKLHDTIGGDLTSRNYYEINVSGDVTTNFEEVETNKTFQLFETSATNYFDSFSANKKVWKDYTDILLDKNQVVKNEKQYNQRNSDVRIKGQNQIFFLGKAICIAQLPIDDSIKNNYTTWGEH